MQLISHKGFSTRCSRDSPERIWKLNLNRVLRQEIRASSGKNSASSPQSGGKGEKRQK